MNNNILFGLILVAVSIFMVGCKSDSAATKKSVFTYNQPNQVTSLDPAFARNMSNIWSVDHIFNGLVQLDEDLNIQPAIAKRWEISEDGKAYLFHLRSDVYFQDHEVFPNGKGRKVVAEDFKYSLGRITDPAVGSPGSWIFKDKLVMPHSFTALNDTLFVIRLQQPFRPMLGILTMQYCSVVPYEAVEKYGKDFGRNPVGTGPFKCVKWLDKQALVLLKNDNYFEKEKGAALPYLNGVRVNFMGDRNTGYLEFMKGNLDFISGLESSFVNELLTKEGALQEKHKPTIDFHKAPFLNTEYLGINLEFEGETPLKKKKVRQALNYAIDREKMLRNLRNNVGQPANAGFIPRGLPSHNPIKVKGYSYNPQKARTLLEEAGYPNGKGLPVIKLFTNNDYKDICTYLTKQWEEIGVQTEIELMQSAVLRDLMVKGKAPLFRASWIADYPDGESFLTVFYSKNPAPPNYTRFNNVKYDELYEQALAENDNTKRYDLYHQMERILIEEAPVVFLFYDETARFSKKQVSGFNNNAINLLSVKRLKF